MVSRKRARNKKILAQSLNHVEKAAQGLAVLHKQFAPGHPEYAAYLSAQIGALLTIQEWMLDFWGKAWGKVPENYSVWRSR